MNTSIKARLSRKKGDQDAQTRYKQDPKSTAFVPYAEVLRSENDIDGAIEVLRQGLQHHPHLAVARVALIRSLYQKGLLEEAWQELQFSPSHIADNLLAQRLRLRMAILRGDKEESFGAIRQLGLAHRLDEESQKLKDDLESGDWPAAYRKVRQVLQQSGIDPKSGVAETPPLERELASVKDERHSRRDSFFEHLQSGIDRLPECDVVVGPLAEVLSPGVSGSPFAGAQGAPFELDSVTLAELYASQGHFGKAVEVYQRLLRLKPQSERLRQRLGELTRLRADQKIEDMTIDPATLDRLECLKIIETQIRFYSGILDRMESSW